MPWEPMPWTSDDDLLWNDQVVGCPRGVSGEVDWTLFELTITHCPYTLEHLMYKEVTRREHHGQEDKTCQQQE